MILYKYFKPYKWIKSSGSYWEGVFKKVYIHHVYKARLYSIYTFFFSFIMRTPFSTKDFKMISFIYTKYRHSKTYNTHLAEGYRIDSSKPIINVEIYLK